MLRIEIGESRDGGDGASISIQGVDFPEAPDDEAAFIEWDKRWTGICNGIRALLGKLGPIPDAGWAVRFWVNGDDHP